MPRLPLESHPTPWYLWPLIPPIFLITAICVGLPLAILALISIPFFWLYPDRHIRLADARGTPLQKLRVAQWRAIYNSLSFPARLRRSLKRFSRRRHRRA